MGRHRPSVWGAPVLPALLPTLPSQLSFSRLGFPCEHKLLSLKHFGYSLRILSLGDLNDIFLSGHMKSGLSPGKAGVFIGSG